MGPAHDLAGHAYQEMFNRRLLRGQSYMTPFLGWSEFTLSYFGPFRETTKVCKELPDIHIPSMLRRVFLTGHESNERAIYQAVYDMDSAFIKVSRISGKRGGVP